MPLLMCPNCQTGMKEIKREEVQIDMCPQCHGVWLDRGELQKLIDISRADEVPASEAPREAFRGPPPSQQHQHEYHKGHHDDYYRYGKYRKKSKLESIFDIFD